MRQTRYRYFLLPLIFMLAGVGVFAQANSELTGIVTDQTGAVVPGCEDHDHRSGHRHSRSRQTAERPACTTFAV